MVSRIRVHRSTNKGLYYTLEIHAQHTYALNIYKLLCTIS